MEDKGTHETLRKHIKHNKHTLKEKEKEKLSLERRSVDKFTLMEHFFIGENVNKQRSKAYSAFSPSVATLACIFRKHCNPTLQTLCMAEGVSPMGEARPSLCGSTSVLPLVMVVPSWRGMSCQWEQRHCVHIRCLAIGDGGTRILPMLLEALMQKQTPFANTLKRDPVW